MCDGQVCGLEEMSTNVQGRSTSSLHPCVQRLTPGTEHQLVGLSKEKVRTGCGLLHEPGHTFRPICCCSTKAKDYMDCPADLLVLQILFALQT